MRLTGIIGGGIMLAGLVAGAMFGGIMISLVIILAGAAVMGVAGYRQLQAEREDTSWRKSYPSYKY